MRVYIERPTPKREADFLQAVRRSRPLHRNWVQPPDHPAAYREYLKVLRRDNQAAFFVCESESGDLAGVIDIDDIVRGALQSASLGYYALRPYAGRGLLREGLLLVINHCFRELKLHRLEANIQPQNRRSIALVGGLGFRLEGVSPRYMKIAGRWRDHQRWAILVDEWRPGRAHLAAGNAPAQTASGAGPGRGG
jgi:ribosomal-protein-alanine N-acetyltransferase